MTTLEDALRRMAEDLTRRKIGFALIGGLAISTRTRPRFTKDVDFAVAVGSDKKAEELLFVLQRDGYRVGAVLDNVRTRRLATARLFMPVSSALQPDVDLLFDIAGIEREVVAEAETLSLLGIEVPVAQRHHLLALKVLSERNTRPRDRDDILALLDEATPADLAATITALDLIVDRGFHQDKDLRAAFQSFIATWTSSRHVANGQEL